MFERILVPLDGSRLSERALGHAARLATAPRSELFLLRVPEAKTMFVPASAGHFDYGLLWPQQALERNSQEAREYLQEVCRRFPDPALRLRILLSEGDPASVIVDTAAQEAIDLIVMSSHGYSGLARWMMGSVAERVVRTAHCPVLIIRSEAPIVNVLITLDGSVLSERALEPGMEVADRLGGSVCLFRSATEAPLPTRVARQLDRMEPGLGERVLLAPQLTVESYLERHARNLRPGGIRPKTIVATGPAAPAILDYAERYGIDLIAMATHGRTGLTRWVQGSVTEKVLRASTCSMLIVPARFVRRPPIRIREYGGERTELPEPSLN
jgi:nucleotide-binding universal stress UspA family protein